jgi:hypothetical protein
MADIQSRDDYRDLTAGLTAEEASVLHQAVGNTLLGGIPVDRDEVVRLVERIKSHRLPDTP